MNITIFTSNQPRHLSLIETLSTIANEVFVVQECSTVFPGRVDDFFKKSEIMQEYFSFVLESERKIFGYTRFLPKNVKTISMKMGDLNKFDFKNLGEALNSDHYVVFGSSFIKGDLIDFLIKNKAINIHMGVSPYYRGSSCNFWALYHKRPDLVGSTIHLLSKGLDSGPMLFHAIPGLAEVLPFDLGMLSVKAAQLGLLNYLTNNKRNELSPVKQDNRLELCYTKNVDFTDTVAKIYLASQQQPNEIYQSLAHRDMSLFLNPYILKI